VRGAVANESLIRAELVQERQQVQLDVVQALLGVRAAKVAITTAQEVETNTKEQLRLAEGRYQAGAGSIIELQDGQVADSNAAAQVIQAEYGLYVARASLKKALGRR
jgi:outer membrane protein